MSQCRAPECQAELVWAMTPAGKRVPLDATPQKLYVAVSQSSGLMLDDEIPVGSESAHVRMVSVYMPHFATCPAAADFRKKLVS